MGTLQQKLQWRLAEQDILGLYSSRIRWQCVSSGGITRFQYQHDRLIEMARQRSSLEVRAGTCAARRMHYQNCQYPYMQLSVQSRAK